jgi:hydrogenase/urease accessory protein HupE
MTARRIALLFALLVALVAATAQAHTVGVSRGEYLWKDGTLYVGVSFARQELAPALLKLDRPGADDFVGFENQREAIGAWLIERLTVKAQGRDTPCPPSFGGMRFDGDGLALALAYACGAPTDELHVEARFPTDLARGHRHLMNLASGDDRFEDVATRAHPLIRFDLRAPAAPKAAPRPAFVQLFWMGIEHIVTGYDHLLFLVGLVLVGRPLRSLLAAVTAFTFAHSATLALAAFDVWAPASRIIEPCIALSIAYIGIENWFVRDARGRWRITFLFGLLHGFGFAGVLREIALPRASVPSALFAFNSGVELGQVAVLAALLPLVIALRPTEIWSRIGMRACSVTIALAGVVWFVSRLHGTM